MRMLLVTKKHLLLHVFHFVTNSMSSFEVFINLKRVQTFLTKHVYSFVQKPIDKGLALVYIDGILFLALTKTHMLDSIEQLHLI